jgi:hypothetical protein
MSEVALVSRRRPSPYDNYEVPIPIKDMLNSVEFDYFIKVNDIEVEIPRRMYIDLMEWASIYVKKENK